MCVCLEIGCPWYYIPNPEQMKVTYLIMVQPSNTCIKVLLFITTGAITMHIINTPPNHLRLTASSRVNTFLPIFVTVCDAQIQPSKCDSYSFLPKFIAHTSFLWTLQKCLRYKCVLYLTQSVRQLQGTSVV